MATATGKTGFFCKWYAAPAIFAAAVAALAAVWAAAAPETVARMFDGGGKAPVEIAALPLFALIVPAVWMKPPFGGSRLRRNLLCCAVTSVALMAIVKETDLHNAALHLLYPDFTGEDGALLPGLFKPNGAPLSGTPFKMRVLTNPGVPLGMKALIVFYFAAFFGVFAAGFAYFAIPWIRGVFAFVPAAWTFGCLGATGVCVQVFDRLPAWRCEAAGIAKDALDPSFKAFCTCFEEGLEVVLALFGLLAVLQGAAALKAAGENR